MFTGLRRGPEPATPPARPRWCDQIPTPAENQLYPYSEHSCAHRHSHDSGKLFAIEGVKSPKTRSCYEYHPPGLSKTVRTAVGRSIFPADGTGRISKPAAGEGEPADRRAHQEPKENPPGQVGKFEIGTSGVSAGPKPRAPIKNWHECEPVHICSAWGLLISCRWGFQGPNSGRRRDTIFRARRRSFFDDWLTAHHPPDNLLTRFQAQLANPLQS